MKNNTLENHFLLSTSLLKHWLLSYSQNTNGGSGSLREANCRRWAIVVLCLRKLVTRVIRFIALSDFIC